MKIGVVGSGAAGLAASWLLAKQHDVVLLETDNRPGGHAHTVWVRKQEPDTHSFDVYSDDVHIYPENGFAQGVQMQNTEGQLAADRVAIDTGFIVYNEDTYPNFTAWMHELGIDSQPTDMSFAVSRQGGAYEYAGGTKTGLIAQPTNLFKLRFWRMCFDIVRFYRQSLSACNQVKGETLGEFLVRGRYSKNFIDDHLLPFGAAIWSTPQQKMLDYPVESFVRFCENHGLLKLVNRPRWRTLSGGSASYVRKVTDELDRKQALRLNFKAVRISVQSSGVLVTAADGRCERFDQVVLACHADQALSLLERAGSEERELLGTFEYEQNLAILHTDSTFMPLRRTAWASWNYVECSGSTASSPPGVVYWMNKLQCLDTVQNYFVSLNPARKPAFDCLIRSMNYEHPVFNHATLLAQQRLWEIQGKDRVWYCGSYFGSGFHEDAVQSGLAVAEQLGNCRRPWSVKDESSRIILGADRPIAAIPA